MEFKVNSTVDLKPVMQILKNHGLDSGGKAQQYITTALIASFDKYVPMRKTNLKESAIRNNAAPFTSIIYNGPYAARMYHNPQYNFNGAPQRGAFWDKRSWSQNKTTILSDFENAIIAGKFN